MEPGAAGVNPNAGIAQWCDRHWKPVRENRAINGLAASVELLNATLADERFQRECGYDPETGAVASMDRANAALAKFSPICCFLGEEVIETIYQKAAIGKAEGKLA